MKSVCERFMAGERSVFIYRHSSVSVEEMIGMLVDWYKLDGRDDKK